MILLECSPCRVIQLMSRPLSERTICSNFSRRTDILGCSCKCSKVAQVEAVGRRDGATLAKTPEADSGTRSKAASYSRRRRTARAFSPCSAMLKDCNIRCSSTLAPSPLREDKAAASSCQVFEAVGPHPPAQPSTTKGKNCRPSVAQACHVLRCWLLIVKGSPPTIGNGMRQLPLSQARGDCEIKRGRAVQVPVRYPDIGRPSLARRLVANMGRTILGAALMLRPLAADLSFQLRAGGPRFWREQPEGSGGGCAV